MASIDSTVYLDSGPASSPPAVGGEGTPAGLSPAQSRMWAAVVSRAGAVEAAEWALDHAMTSCDEQIVAALSSALPPEVVAKAAGMPASAIDEIVAAHVSA